MKSYIDILIEGIVPTTEYGYWIDSEGEIHAVDNQEHAKFCKERGLNTVDALKGGWVRVIAYVGWLAVEFREHLSPRCALAVKRIAQKRFDNYTLDWQFFEDRKTVGDRFETKSRIAFLSRVDEMTA